MGKTGRTRSNMRVGLQKASRLNRSLTPVVAKRSVGALMKIPSRVYKYSTYAGVVAFSGLLYNELVLNSHDHGLYPLQGSNYPHIDNKAFPWGDEPLFGLKLGDEHMDIDDIYHTGDGHHERRTLNNNNKRMI